MDQSVEPATSPASGWPAHHDAAVAALRTAVDDGVDVGEFIATALARLAAERGSSASLFNRPGSWEAGLVRQLVSGTVGGPGDEDFSAYRSQQ